MTAMRCYCYCYCYCGNPQGGWSKEKETRTKRRAVGVSPPTRRPLRRVALVVVALLLMQLLPLPCSSWSSSPIPPRTGSRTSSGTPTTPMASSLSFRTRRRRTADAATATAALSSPSKLFIPIIQVLSLQCQLLGINCAEPQEIALTWNEFCERGGATDIHADGWGLAYYSVVVGSSNGNSNNSNSNSNRTNATATSLLPLPSATAVPSSPPAAKGGLRVFYDTQAAATSPLARFLGQPATADCSKDNNNNSNIQTCNLLAHLRYATTGSAANLANVHPFVRECV